MGEIKTSLRVVIDWLDAQMEESPDQKLADVSNYLEERYQVLGDE